MNLRWIVLSSSELVSFVTRSNDQSSYLLPLMPQSHASLCKTTKKVVTVFLFVHVRALVNVFSFCSSFIVKTPEDVQSRYLAVLETYKETCNLTRTWEVHGVDWDTIVCTSVIAEVHLAANSEEKIRMPPFAGGSVEKYAKEMKDFFYSEPALRKRIEEKKANREFLPISYKLKGAKGCASIASDFWEIVWTSFHLPTIRGVWNLFSLSLNLYYLCSLWSYWLNQFASLIWSCPSLFIKPNTSCLCMQMAF